MSYNCNLCDKEYKSYKSLWNHTKKFHNDIKQEITLNDTNQKDIFNCQYCNKQFTRKNNMNYHIKNNCKDKMKMDYEITMYKDAMIDLIENQKKMQAELNKLKKQKNGEKKIINYNGTINANILNTINNNSNNTLNICNPGDENINLLTNDEKKLIMSQGVNSIISLVDHLNFNERLPQYHNFYVSALNDKHVNTLDKSSNSIIKQSKKDVFDQILFAHVNKLENINNNINYKDFDNAFNKLKAFIFLKKGKKEYFNQLNMLSYNKRHLIVKTWENLINDDSIKPEDMSNALENKIKQITEDTGESDDENYDSDNKNYDSDTESVSESCNSSETDSSF